MGEIMPYILALDQSLTATGAATVHLTADGPRYAVDLWVPPKNCIGVQRLAWFEQCVKELDLPVLLCLEGYGFSRVENAAPLGELGGVLKLSAHNAGVPIIAVPPSSLKSWATGRGNADKDSVMLEAAKHWPGLVEGNNQADALWLAEIAYHYYAKIEGSNEKRRKVLSDLRAADAKLAAKSSTARRNRKAEAPNVQP
jgi:hypothetical protein